MINILVIALGGAIGSILRFFIYELGVRVWGTAFPFSILCVNIVGSFLIGCVLGAMYHYGKDANSILAYFLVTGLLGGFTTFSSFSYDTFLLFYENKIGLAFGNIILNVFLCITATAVAFIITNKVLQI